MDLGVKEIFVTGGEPFLLENIGDILAACASAAPTTVLTNAMLFNGRRAESLRALLAIVSSCKSAWIAQRRACMIFIAGRGRGGARAKALSMLAREAFE
jgi:hypothetical protein